VNEVERAALQHESILASLAIFQPDARAAARLIEALVEESIDGCVVDADDPSRPEARAEIEAIHQNHPCLAIIADADVAGELEYYDLGELGVDGVLLAGRLEADQIRSELW
jgi:hypothetical protein